VVPSNKVNVTKLRHESNGTPAMDTGNRVLSYCTGWPGSARPVGPRSITDWDTTLCCVVVVRHSPVDIFPDFDRVIPREIMLFIGKPMGRSIMISNDSMFTCDPKNRLRCHFFREEKCDTGT